MSLEFGGIAFNLSDLVQTFWISFRQNWWTWVMSVGCPAHAAQPTYFDRIEGFMAAKTLTLVSLSHFVTKLEVCLVSLSNVPVPLEAKTPPQHEATTLVLHSWDGVLRLASFLLFCSKEMMVIMAKLLNFSFSDHRTCLQILRSLSLCAFANWSLTFFNVVFGVMAS